MKSTIKYPEKEIKRIEESLSSYIEEIFSQQFKPLTSVKGIGATPAVALIVTTGAFSSFDNSKQLTKYLGLSPIHEQSGTSVLHRGISIGMGMANQGLNYMLLLGLQFNTTRLAKLFIPDLERKENRESLQ